MTGVSTGALTAPFAFLGPDYDADLERVYTETSATDVMTSRGLLGGLLGDSLFNSAPLLRLIRHFVTPAFLAAIAREYSEKGRLLFVATTNLDVPVGVLWNMGSIAASGHPQAAELFANILLACDLLKNFGGAMPAERSEAILSGLMAGVTSMVRTLDDLLLAGKIEEGKLPYTPARFALLDFLKRCCLEVQPDLTAIASMSSENFVARSRASMSAIEQ